MESLTDHNLNVLFGEAKRWVPRVFVRECKTKMKSFLRKHKTDIYYEVYFATRRLFIREDMQDHHSEPVQLYHWGDMKFAINAKELNAYLLGLINGADQQV